MDREFLENIGVEGDALEAILQAFEQTRQAHEAQMAEVRLEQAVVACGGRSLKAIRALMEEPPEGDYKQAVERVKEAHPYLFSDPVTPPPFAGGTGGNSHITAPESLASALRERFSKKN